MNENPRVEIRTVEGSSGAFTEILIDGHKLPGVRRFELKQEVGNNLPILTVDLNALNLATDIQVLRLNHAGMGTIKDIIFEGELEE